MNLQTFISKWILNDKDIIVCDIKHAHGADMQSLINELDRELHTGKYLAEYAIFKFSPKYNGIDISIFAKQEWCKASVELFYIGESFAIVWVELKGDSE